MNETVHYSAYCVVTMGGIDKLIAVMGEVLSRQKELASKEPAFGFGRFIIVCVLFLFVQQGLMAGLDADSVHNAFGNDFERIKQVPGRPWVEEQHRYEKDGVLISCNFVAGRCLWIDFWSKEKKLDEAFVFEKLNLLFPGEVWTPVDSNGKLKRWLNKDEDRVTQRSTGFTLHMNEYIRNVLSRRAQWQF